jgi:3-phosphoshikimate 1-carboxyvinyltransferase
MRSVQGLEITIKDELVSKPYVEMTIKLMEKFGVVVERLDGLEKLRIPGCQTYVSPGTVFVEGDASSASYFLAGATMTGGTIRVVGCGSESVQVRSARLHGRNFAGCKAASLHRARALSLS